MEFPIMSISISPLIKYKISELKESKNLSSIPKFIYIYIYILLMLSHLFSSISPPLNRARVIGVRLL